MSEHIILVAVSVEAPNRATAEVRATSWLGAPAGPVEAWWVAEDFRIDSSDCDSAVFVQPGMQARASRLLAHHGLTSSANITPLERCADCGDGIQELQEKAVASGEVATVWSSENGWVCDTTGQEHRPLYREMTR